MPHGKDVTLPSGIIVHETVMCLGGERYYTAWEPSQAPSPRFYRHSSLMSFADGAGFYGRIGTEVLPPEIDAIPIGPERFAACAKWRDECYARAYAAILQAHPHLADLPREIGEIGPDWPVVDEATLQLDL